MLDLNGIPREETIRAMAYRMALAVKQEYIASLRSVKGKYKSYLGGNYAPIMNRMEANTSVRANSMTAGLIRILVHVRHPLATILQHGESIKPRSAKAIALPIVAPQGSRPSSFSERLHFRPPAPGFPRSALNEPNFIGTLRYRTGMHRGDVAFALYRKVQFPKVQWVPTWSNVVAAIHGAARTALSDITTTRT